MIKKTKFKKDEVGIVFDELENKKFKKLIKKLYKYFPNGQIIEDEIKKVIISEKMRNQLINNSFLIKESIILEGKEKFYYSLGPNSLTLVSSWETEELTKKMKNLTYWIIVLTGISILLALI